MPLINAVDSYRVVRVLSEQPGGTTFEAQRDGQQYWLKVWLQAAAYAQDVEQFHTSVARWSVPAPNTLHVLDSGTFSNPRVRHDSLYTVQTLPRVRLAEAPNWAKILRDSLPTLGQRVELLARVVRTVASLPTPVNVTAKCLCLSRTGTSSSSTPEKKRPARRWAIFGTTAGPEKKPLEVLWDPVGSPVFLSQSALQQTSVSGVPDPVSPEELNSQREIPPEATAIWYLGMLGHQLLTGIAPPRGIDGLSYSMRPFTHLREVDAACPEELDNLLARMLSQDPTERPQSFEDIVAILHYVSRQEDGAGERR